MGMHDQPDFTFADGFFVAIYPCRNHGLGVCYYFLTGWLGNIQYRIDLPLGTFVAVHL
jgi:hypothetical protein